MIKKKMTKAPVMSSRSHIKKSDNKLASFPVVGIGASAGGLEALEQFFHHAHPDSGMAYVLVSHLDPGHASMLTEILQRTTTMPVVEAADQMVIAPNQVFVIPPNRDMRILHGVLQLTIPELPRGQRMPIDAFLRSLAEDQGERAIGIILSGTGTDGTLGLRAILGAGGVTLVQEPSTVKYDGMPVSAIQAGYASHILPVEKMPEILQIDLDTLAIRGEMPPSSIAADGVTRILALLRTGTGHDFSQYKKTTISRRIERRMMQHNIEDIDIYARYLSEHPSEVQTLFKELLINVTSFFRDQEAFEMLRHDILPQLLEGKPDDYVFRVWVTACATGEEAYSIAILLQELMEEAHRALKVQIYATDIDDDAVAIARTGVFPPNITQDVTPERLRRFFVKEENGYRVKKTIREMVVFAIQNVIKDPPFTKLDLLSCRNLMIYLEPELQNRLISTFHYVLKPGGVLFLSPSESIGTQPELFTPLSRQWKFYRAVPSASFARNAMHRDLTWLASGVSKIVEETSKPAKESNFAELARKGLLHFFAPASVVTDLKGNILYVHGDTSKYLRSPPGRATLNVVDMARDGLSLELISALQGIVNHEVPTLNREVVMSNNGQSQNVRLSVQSLPNADSTQDFLLISFQDVAHVTPLKPARKRSVSGADKVQRVQELESELLYTKENLRAMLEEQQVANEEFKSTYEEMQSTNEELQSTNEELETSKEELQSVNEELITVNAELQSKIEQLTNMQNDMKNLLDNINIGTIFLDERMSIRRFTREAVQVYRLVASDVGRSLGDIKCELQGVDLLTEAQKVLDTLVAYERELHSIRGASYLVRIQPYRTLDNVIEGVVLTFTDISKRVAAEATELQAKELAEGIVDTLHEPLLVLNADLQVISASRAFYQHFHVRPEETLMHHIYELGNRQWDIPALRELLEAIVPNNQSFDNYMVEHEFPVVGYRKFLLNARRIVGKVGDAPLILLAMEDVTWRKDLIH